MTSVPVATLEDVVVFVTLTSADLSPLPLLLEDELLEEVFGLASAPISSPEELEESLLELSGVLLFVNVQVTT